MSLGSLVESLSIPLAAIRESAPDAIKLAHLYRAAIGKPGASPQGIYSRFIGAAFKADFTMAQARASYQLAKFWGTYGAQLSGWLETTPLDPRIAGESRATQTYIADFGRWRTFVSVTVHDPLTGESKRYGFYLHDTSPPTPASIQGRAELALEDVIRESPTIGGRTNLGGLELTYSIDEFVSLV